MRNNLTTDFIRGNKTSSITIAVTVIISSFLLTLLTTTLYNFWIDAALQAQIQGADCTRASRANLPPPLRYT